MPDLEQHKIPFNRPTIAGKELDYVREAIDRGQLADDGYFMQQSCLKDYFGAPAVLLTHSCTAALEMAAMLIGIRPGGEVTMPPFTLVSTANEVVLRGGVAIVLAAFYFGVADPLLACELGLC
jgi:dTDP-4-amino-4,6-dideoxygalactose transaminase